MKPLLETRKWSAGIVLERKRRNAIAPVTLAGRVAIIIGLTVLTLPLFGGSEAANIFNQRCAGCHTYGKGIRVGPDLKGVTDRHPRIWLLRFIRSSQTVIHSGDPVATALFQEFKQQRMPDHELSPQQIEALLDYLAQGGPSARPPDERTAYTATLAEVEAGRRLFYGELRLANGSQACSSCHRAGDKKWIGGGSLGPTLTNTYWKYQDKALTSLLRRPCFPRAPEVLQRAYLTPQESFELKAYLRQISLTHVNPQQAAALDRKEIVRDNARHSARLGTP
jgi:mono/diheme cytochrome c family protein